MDSPHSLKKSVSSSSDELAMDDSEKDKGIMSSSSSENENLSIHNKEKSRPSSSSEEDDFVHIHEKDVMKSPSSTSEEGVSLAEAAAGAVVVAPEPKAQPEERVVLRADPQERVPSSSPKPPTSPKPSHIPRVTSNNNG
ncbi:Hypothetical protein FKW44_002616, partial [Caligus rogercresseyi]